MIQAALRVPRATCRHACLDYVEGMHRYACKRHRSKKLGDDTVLHNVAGMSLNLEKMPYQEPANGMIVEDFEMLAARRCHIDIEVVFVCVACALCLMMLAISD